MSNAERSDQHDATQAHFRLPHAEEAETAWEEIEAGRYMPRRVRGSCVGRALG